MKVTWCVGFGFLKSQCIVLAKIYSENEKKTFMGFVYRVLWIPKALWIVLSEAISILRNLQKHKHILGCPPLVSHRFMYIAPSSVIHCWTSMCLLNWFQGVMRLFSDVWSENAALFKRLMKLYSNPPIVYYGFDHIGMLTLPHSKIFLYIVISTFHRTHAHISDIAMSLWVTLDILQLGLQYPTSINYTKSKTMHIYFLNIRTNGLNFIQRFY